MTNLGLLQTLTDNICIAKGVDPNDINQCLILAKQMNNIDVDTKNCTTIEYRQYKHDRFMINIPTNVALKFEDLVAPINDVLLESYTRFYTNDKYINDEVISAIITASMLQEVNQYAKAV